MTNLIDEKKLTQGQYYFICGNDDYLVDREGRKLYNEKGANLIDSFSREIIEAEASNVSKVEFVIHQFIESAQMPSLFGGEKVIWFRGINFLGDSPIGKAEGTKERVEWLLQVLTNLNYENLCIIITASPIDKRTRLFKALKNTPHFLLIEEDGALSKMITQECQLQEVKITQEAIETLIEKINGNSRLLMQEIQKLITFVGKGKTIDGQLVNEMVAQFGEGDFFEFSDAFFSLDIHKSLNALTRYFFTQKEARPLISSLLNRLRLLIQLRVLLDAGSIEASSYGLNKNTLQQLAEKHGFPFGETANKSGFNVFSQNPWYLGKLTELAKKIPLKNLINFELQLLKAFEDILQHSQPQEQEAIMRQLVMQCLTFN